MKMGVLEALDSYLWRDDFWLPDGLSWSDLSPEEDKLYPQPHEIWVYPILLSIMLVVFRSWILNPIVFEPIAKFFKLQYRKPKLPAPNPDLERIFKEYKGSVPSKVIEKTCVSLPLPRRDIERWLRERSSLTRLTKLEKFQDSAFIFTYHVLITVYGFYVMWEKPWLWDITLCYRNFPYHDIDTYVWWYYMVGCAFYWSLIIWQFKLSHGRDAKMAYAHHLCTIILMITSWKCNYTRIGTIVLFLHECGDIPLQVGKMLRYLKDKVIIDYVFAIFVILWFVTRLVLFPFWILRSLFVEMPKYVTIARLTVFHVLLVLLFLMNVVWSAFIAYGIYDRLVNGVVKNVVSSDDENNDASDDGKKEERSKEALKND